MTPAPQRILIVEDDEDIRNLLTGHLCTEGYVCVAAASVPDALQELDRQPVDLVLADYNMPGGNGLELLYLMRQRQLDAAFVMATAAHDVRIAVDALTQGASDYLLKPLELRKVSASVRAALQKRRLEHERLGQVGHLEAMLDAVAHHAADQTLQALAMALDLRAGDVYGHSQRVGRYSVELARHLGYDRPALKRLEHAALVHDIGKMRIPDSILLKPAQLTPDENAIMRTHVTIGYELVRAQPRLAPYAELVFTHHERFDGQGYPRGLAGGAVPLDARIFAVADTLDAMTSERPYRKALGWDVANAEIVRHSGSQFDPKVVRAFCEIPAVTWIRIGTTQPVLTFTERQ